MHDAVVRRMDEAAFHRWHARQNTRHELVDGVPVAMVGTSRRHGLMALNAASAFRATLRGGPCAIFVTDFAVKIPNGNIRYPDVLIDCGATKDDARTASEPTLVLEVLSRSTSRFDQSEKLEEYKSIPTLACIVFVDPATPRVRAFAREGEGHWQSRLVSGLDAVAVLPAGLSIALAALYEGVALQAGPRLVADAPEDEAP